MGKKTIYEVAYGKGRGVRKVLVDSKAKANRLKKNLASSGLFTEGEFRIKSVSLGTDGGIRSLLKRAKKKIKKTRGKK